MKKKESPVLFIITKLELGGAQKVCLTLFKNLQEAYLISGTEGPLVNDVQSHKNVFLLPSFKREVSIKGILLEINNFITLVKHMRRLKKINPDLIVHTHSTKAGLVGRWAAFFAGIKKRIHTIHGYGFHPYQSKISRFSTYFLELITSFITTHYVCVSTKDAKTGMSLFPRFQQKHSIIRAAIEWDSFVSRSTQAQLNKEKPFVFGTIACFKKQKNLIDLCKAFKLAYQQNPQMRLEIIGDGSLRPQLEEWLDKNNMKHLITLHGWQKEVAAIMQYWHAFTLSSLWEGLPCSIIEARLLKLPVISYNTGGISDVIMHGDNGFLITQGNWQELAHYMVQISTDKNLYHKMQNYQDNLESFHYQSMIDAHCNLYKQLN